jgi:protein involved in ribonucleotide reduction
MKLSLFLGVERFISKTAYKEQEINNEKARENVKSSHFLLLFLLIYGIIKKG